MSVGHLTLTESWFCIDYDVECVELDGPKKSWQDVVENAVVNGKLMIQKDW